MTDTGHAVRTAPNPDIAFRSSARCGQLLLNEMQVFDQSWTTGAGSRKVMKTPDAAPFIV